MAMKTQKQIAQYNRASRIRTLRMMANRTQSADGHHGPNFTEIERRQILYIIDEALKREGARTIDEHRKFWLEQLEKDNLTPTGRIKRGIKAPR
jgi:hypothetical protein